MSWNRSFRIAPGFAFVLAIGAALATPSTQQDPTATACELLLDAHLAGSGQSRQLSATAENTTDHELALSFPDRCPAGSIDFTGLPAGYDYYSTCNKGACPGTRAPKVVRLAAHEQRVLETTSLALGGNACQHALPPALYQIRPSAPALPIHVCVDDVRLDLRKPATPPKPTPPPAPAPSDRYACSAPDDCVLSCPPTCCGYPCGCRNAINKAFASVATAPLACAKPPKCPVVDCAFQPAHSATCVDGRCVAR